MSRTEPRPRAIAQEALVCVLSWRESTRYPGAAYAMIRNWPDNALVRLVGLDVLVPTHAVGEPPPCGCEEGCWVETEPRQWSEGNETVRFRCHYRRLAARTVLNAAESQCWRLDVMAFARHVAAALMLEGEVRALLPEHCWVLGSRVLAGATRTFVLGSRAQDLQPAQRRELLDALSPLPNIVLFELPNHDSRSLWVVPEGTKKVELVPLLTLDGDGLDVDEGQLATQLLPAGGGVSAARPMTEEKARPYRVATDGARKPLRVWEWMGTERWGYTATHGELDSTVLLLVRAGVLAPRHAKGEPPPCGCPVGCWLDTEDDHWARGTQTVAQRCLHRRRTGETTINTQSMCWRIDVPGIAQRLAKALRLDGEVREIEPKRCWVLGRRRIAGAERTFVFGTRAQTLSPERFCAAEVALAPLENVVLLELPDRSSDALWPVPRDARHVELDPLLHIVENGLAVDGKGLVRQILGQPDEPEQEKQAEALACAPAALPPATDAKTNPPQEPEADRKREDVRPAPLIPVPPGTTWADIHFYRIDGTQVSIRVGSGRCVRRTCQALGMSKGESDQPSIRWKILIEMCVVNRDVVPVGVRTRRVSEDEREDGEHESEIDDDSFNHKAFTDYKGRVLDRRALKKQVSELGKDLRRIFGLTDRPFDKFQACTREGWNPRFNVHPCEPGEVRRIPLPASLT